MQIIDTIVVRAQNAWFAARDEESGQTLVEYALIIALVGIAAIVALTFLSDNINNLFNKTGNVLNNAG
jgi:pilus assembly protein Flp/PilA